MRLISLGNTGIGKTYHLNLFNGLTSSLLIAPTIGVNVLKVAKMQVWDASGDPKFTSMLHHYVQMSDIALFWFASESSLGGLRNRWRPMAVHKPHIIMHPQKLMVDEYLRSHPNCMGTVAFDSQTALYDLLALLPVNAASESSRKRCCTII